MARTRGQVQTKPAAPKPAAKPKAKLSGEMIQMEARGKSYRMPVEIYEGQHPMNRQEYLDRVDGAEELQGDGAVALRGVGQLLDEVGLLRSQLSNERQRNDRLEELVLRLADRQEQQQTTIEVAKSDALAEQQIQAGQQATNLAALSSDLDSKATRLEGVGEQVELQISTATAAAEQPLSELEGRIKAAVELYAQGVIANQGKLAEQELRSKRLDVRLQEAEALIANSQDVMTLASNLGELDRHIGETAIKAVVRWLNKNLVGLIKEKFMPASPTVDITEASQKTPQFAPKPNGNPLGLG